VKQQSSDLYRFEKQVVRLWRSGDISPGTVRTYLGWVHRFYAYCGQNSLASSAQLTLDGARRFARRYRGPRTEGPISSSTCLVAKNALHAWAFAVGSLGIELPEWSASPAPTLELPIVREYREFRRCHRGVAAGTLRRDCEVASAFLSKLRNCGKSANRVTVSDIDAFVIEQARHESRRTLATTCCYLRSFLRFLRSTGRLHRDLAVCVVSPRVRVLERPPRALPWIDIKWILRRAQCERSPGKRDYAMLLMMALYGLGAAEVLSLQIEDVSWQTGVIDLCRPKTGVRIELPLLPPVARALVAYLRQERPSGARTRRIFVSTMIPYKPLSSAAIRHRIREYARQAGVTSRTLGAHAFRHAHASRQVDAGANLKVVSDILGHRRPSSTSVYVRVAIRRLRGVALPVPK